MKHSIKALLACAASVSALTLTGCVSVDPKIAASTPPVGAGWVALLDGTNLNAFLPVGNANIRLDNGVAQAEIGTGYLWTKKPYQNFELSAEVYVDGVANSGIMIRCSDPKKVGADLCYEFNVWDTRPDPTYATGAIVNVSKVTDFPKTVNKWNTLNIKANGPHLQFTVNGIKTADVQNNKLLEGGSIALQFDGFVKFKNVWIRPL
jgi:hypothetical protein